MSVTQTNTTTSASGFRTLSAEQQSPPVQQFRVGEVGTIVPVEAEWDRQLQQFCYHVDELRNHLGVRVDHVRRAENGVYVNRLRDQNDEMYVFKRGTLRLLVAHVQLTLLTWQSKELTN